MTKTKQTPEKPTPLGDRVYKKHRKMLSEVARKLGKDVKNAEVTRRAIEEIHARHVGKNS